MAAGLLLTGQARAQEAALGGFYVNGFAGAAIIDSTVNFAATANRPAGRFVDQGGDGLLVGARLGWGTVLAPHLYAGVELEGVFPYNVTSRLMAYGAEYRARLRNEIGGYARVGWTSDGGSVVFARAGFSMPRQIFQSTQSPGGRNSAAWSAVPAFGVGAEVPVWGPVFARFDVGYSMQRGANRLETYRLNAGFTLRF
ncbi:hypothetical protein [Plastoroseomonas arctica]|uniref:Outer membrane protein beta-barrel domain-containing protein n=1 Tax=Plastoroseomonas arctica TaxID=1509237 RepID=A0AAF1JX01_9PROT|nr:hypothetical protein [Plastoroseomonas arctica]MBR0655747.1 hypothetical protein [Plastoroseomonas arctica]